MPIHASLSTKLLLICLRVSSEARSTHLDASIEHILHVRRGLAASEKDPSSRGKTPKAALSAVPQP